MLPFKMKYSAFPKILVHFLLLVSPQLEPVSSQLGRPTVKYDREWLTSGYLPTYNFCKPKYPEPPPPPPPPTTTTTTPTTTTTTTTTTTPTTTTDNSTDTTTTSTTTTTTSTTSTSTTSTTSTTTTTTTTTTRWVDSCPNQPDEIFLKDGHGIRPVKEEWWSVADREPLKNVEHIIKQICPAYFTGMLFNMWTKETVPQEVDKMDSCLNPMSLDPFRWTPEQLEWFANNPLELGPLKERRHVPYDDNNKNNKDEKDDNTFPFECPNINLGRREKYCYACQTTRLRIGGGWPQPIEQKFPTEHQGRIQPFVGLWQTCTLENEAYLHGVVLIDILDEAEELELKLPKNKVYTGDDEEEDEDELFDDEPPWGRLNKYWPQLYNLNVARMDKDDGKALACAHLPDDSDDERIRKEIYYGDCIFNQRLATDNGPDERTPLGDEMLEVTLKYEHCYPDPDDRGWTPPTTTTTTTTTTESTTTEEPNIITSTTTEANNQVPGRRRRSFSEDGLAQPADYDDQPHSQRLPRQAQPQPYEIHDGYKHKNFDLKYKLPRVGLGCNPIQFLSCSEEYNEDQMLSSTCICNPMYSMENPIYSPDDPNNLRISKVEEEERKNEDLINFVKKIYNVTTLVQEERLKKEIPCFPMAGVPCRFNRTGTKIDEWLPNYEIPCAFPDLMDCVDINSMTNPAIVTLEDKWKFFSNIFAGFAMSPIARDYMVERATGVCMCKGRFTTHVQTLFNECVVRDSGYRMGLNWSLLMLAFAAILVF